MYSFRGYNNPGRAIKPSFERPAKTETVKIRSPSLGTLPISRNRKEVEPIIEDTIKELDKQYKVEIIEENRDKKSGKGTKRSGQARKNMSKAAYAAPMRRIAIKKQKRLLNARDIKVKLLKEKGLTYSQIANALGLSRHQVAGICYRAGF